MVKCGHISYKHQRWLHDLGPYFLDSDLVFSARHKVEGLIALSSVALLGDQMHTWRCLLLNRSRNPLPQQTSYAIEQKLPRIILLMEALELNELIESKLTEGNTFAGILPAGPCKVL